MLGDWDRLTVWLAGVGRVRRGGEGGGNGDKVEGDGGHMGCAAADNGSPARPWGWTVMALKPYVGKTELTRDDGWSDRLVEGVWVEGGLL
jgi:hypothetical protein